MFVDESGYWQKAPKETRPSPNQEIYVFFGIFLACLLIPAGIILWAIASSIAILF